MRKAIVTAAFGGEYEAMSARSFPTIEAYAGKIGADFVPLGERRFPDRPPYFEKFQLFELLSRYDRVVWMDSDLLVRPDCPDLFGLVPEHEVGAFNEGAFIPERRVTLAQAMRFYGFPPPPRDRWKGEYYNTGVLVASRLHRYLFDPKDAGEGFPGDGTEQTLVNCRMLDQGVDSRPLEYRFNRMTCMDGFLGMPRHDAYVIHYAGAPDTSVVQSLMLKDIATWNAGAPEHRYRRNVLVTVAGGLGDQVAVEPVVRKVISMYGHDSDISVVTHWPDAYRHLESEGVRVWRVGAFRGEPDTPYYEIRTLSRPEDMDGSWMFMSHNLTHPTEFASLLALRSTLALGERTVRLEVTDEDRADLFSAAGTDDLGRHVLLHPGKGWPSKTFPGWWWEAVAEGLMSEGIPVAVIGKRFGEDQGLVDLDVPAGALDLVNRLDLRTMVACVSEAAGLVSNDSSPVHVAGAFDGWIFLVATCKAPHWVLPFRRGRQSYKARALHGRPMWEELDVRPTNVHCPTIDSVPGGSIEPFLPDPETVIGTVASCVGSGRTSH